MTWMQSYSGHAVSFLTPDVRDICPKDIAVHLSRQPRFNGATRLSHSIAQHSLHVCRIVQNASPNDTAAHLWAILHDAHEAYTGDLVTPLQKAIEALLPTGWPNPIKTIQDRLDREIARRFGLSWATVEAVKPLIRRADMIALATEKAQLLRTPPQDWAIVLPPPDDVELDPLPAGHAEFLYRSELTKCLVAHWGMEIGQELAA